MTAGLPGDGLAIERIFPDAAPLLSHRFVQLADVQTTCDVVLDTNVLLLPYTTGSDSLKAITKVYAALKKDGRLFVPAQVAREFARNRAKKLADIIKTLADKRSKAAAPDGHSYPLITELKEYHKLVESGDALKLAVGSYQKAVTSLLDAIETWGWNDPVSGMYSDIFTPETVRERADDDILREQEFRTANKIPPGYKDASKDDEGIGDLVIWQTIIDLGRDRHKPLLFVTGDEKADWQHREDHRGLLPRYELVDEYRRNSAGETFHIASFSRFLALFDASHKVVTEVRESEQVQQYERINEKIDEAVECIHCDNFVTFTLGERVGSSATPRCDACHRWFHAHRLRGGAIQIVLPGKGATNDPSGAVISPAERRILQALAQGRSPKDVAEDLGRSLFTVQKHISDATEKLGCESRANAIEAARDLGLIE